MISPCIRLKYVLRIIMFKKILGKIMSLGRVEVSLKARHLGLSTETSLTLECWSVGAS